MLSGKEMGVTMKIIHCADLHLDSALKTHLSAEKARELTGCDVFFERERAEADDHEMTYAELVGYTLCDASAGKEVGKIAFVDEATDNILFELEDGRLLPASEELIVEIDQASHTVVLVIPEGLLDL